MRSIRSCASSKAGAARFCGRRLLRRRANGRSLSSMRRKLSERLGVKWALPVEALSFGLRAHVEYIERLGAAVEVRTRPDGSPFRTDSGNLILDCQFGPMEEPECIAGALERHAGVIEHGLFIDLVTDLIVASPSGTHHLTR